MRISLLTVLHPGGQQIILTHAVRLQGYFAHRMPPYEHLVLSYILTHPLQKHDQDETWVRVTGAKLNNRLKSQSDDLLTVPITSNMFRLFALLTQNKTRITNTSLSLIAVVSLKLTKLCDRPQAFRNMTACSSPLIRRAGPAPMTSNPHPLYSVTCDIISFAAADGGAKAEHGHVDGDHCTLGLHERVLRYHPSISKDSRVP